jgi:hypothetical protein
MKGEKMASKEQAWITLMLLSGLILAGCKMDDTGPYAGPETSKPYAGPKTIVITGFNLEVTTGIECAIYWDLAGQPVARRWSNITGTPADISMELIDLDTTLSGTHPENGEQPWTGIGNYFISFNPDGEEYFYSADGTNNIKRLPINNAVTTLDWAKFVKNPKKPGALNSLLHGAVSEIQQWGEMGTVTVYSFNPEIKDELFRAVEDAGFYQFEFNSSVRNWDLGKGVLRWCVPSDTEKWTREIQFSPSDETTLYTYGFKPIPIIPNSDGRPKTIKITGYDSQGGITANAIQIFSEQEGFEIWPPDANAAEEIDGQTITYRPRIWTSNYRDDNVKPCPWTGTGKFFIVIDCDPPKNNPLQDGSIYVYSADGTNPTPVDIKAEVTTLEWAKFIWQRDYTEG